MGWIDKAIKKPGSLRKSLGVKGDDPIPEGKLEAAAEKGGKLGQRARLAQTLKEMNMSKHGMQMGTSGFGATHGMKPNYEKHHEAQETPAQEAYERRTGNEAQHLYMGVTHDYSKEERAKHGCMHEYKGHGFGPKMKEMHERALGKAIPDRIKAHGSKLIKASKQGSHPRRIRLATDRALQRTSKAMGK